MMVCSKPGLLGTAVVLGMAASSCGFHHAKYDNPITKDTQQPDKVLFDRAVKDIQKGHYETARLTLNTLINTYDSSEYLAKAQLAIADSWYREGGINGMAQAEAEYKNFILFYPTLEEAAESQYKLCMIHFRQMEKPDRDSNQALRTEQECKQVLVQFPNSKYAPQAEQRLRETQEVLAEAEMRVGDFQHHRGDWQASANRLSGLVGQYPLYSKADDALWEEADSYSHMGPRFRQRVGDAYSKIVRDYPLSEHADAAKKKLEAMEMPVPDADPAAVARMKFEAENRTKESILRRGTDFLRGSPDVSMAAKEGAPTMTPPKPTVPALVPVPAATAAEGGGSFAGDVTIAPVNGTPALDTKPDARSQAPAGTPQSATAASATSQTQADDASANSTSKKTKDKKKKKKGQKNQDEPQVQTPATSSPQ